MDNVWLNPAYAKGPASKAIFADRDGTLIKHVDYIDAPEKVSLLPGVKECIHAIIQAGIPFFILTNQSGVGRGYFPIERVYACQKKLFELLEIEPTEIAGWCIAPEAPDQTGGYRKPSPRFIEEACQVLAQPAEQCHVIGDTLVDLETAWNAGAHAWAVSCGKPELPARIARGEIQGNFALEADFPSCIRSIIG